MRYVKLREAERRQEQNPDRPSMYGSPTTSTPLTPYVGLSCGPERGNPSLLSFSEPLRSVDVPSPESISKFAGTNRPSPKYPWSLLWRRGGVTLLDFLLLFICGTDWVADTPPHDI